MWAPGVLGGLWLVGIGHGELMLALCLPLAVVGALCFLPLPGEPVPVEESLPAPAGGCRHGSVDEMCQLCNNPST